MNPHHESYSDDSVLLQAVGRWSYFIYHEREMLTVYLHLIFSALFPIYIGAHASLYRPPSAKSSKKSASSAEEDEDEDESEFMPMTEGLQPSDAILFPIMAGLTLGGLYLVITWLNDPAILNRILGYYFSALGILGVGKLVADGLNVGTTFIFPSVWSDGMETYHIDSLISRQVTGRASKSGDRSARKAIEGKSNPFPGVLSKIDFPDRWTRSLWSIRALFKDRWTFRGYVHGLVEIKSKIRLNDVIGFIIGMGAVILYNLTGKTWWLTNLIAFGFCYGTFQLLSPTTFWTGSLVLAGLFVYDIVMVFYTPMMVTVATTLDVPIKLVFPGPTRESMLGLGDVILPGLMIALALRFDLYLHYLSLQKAVVPFSPALSPLTSRPESHVPGSPRTEKAVWVEAGGKWGERFWTRKRGIGAKIKHPDLRKVNDEKTTADGTRFKKVYFNAGLAGYVVGMVATLIVLVFYEHAQPALLYLVPGVLISLWATAWARGDIRLMWAYTEDGSLDEDAEQDNNAADSVAAATGDKSKEKQTNNIDMLGVHSIRRTDDHKAVANLNKSKDSHAQVAHVNANSMDSPDGDRDRNRDGQVDGDGDASRDHRVFLFSLSAPPTRSLRKK